MENIKKIQILEEIEQLSKQIQLLIIEKAQNQNNYNEKLKIFYYRMNNLHTEFKKLIPTDNHNDGSQQV